MPSKPVSQTDWIVEGQEYECSQLFLRAARRMEDVGYKEMAKNFHLWVGLAQAQEVNRRSHDS